MTHPLNDTERKPSESFEKIFTTVVAVMLFIGFPLWVVLDVGSTAFCRIYECPINRTSDD